MTDMRYALDTNILLRLNGREKNLAFALLIEKLIKSETELCMTAQCMGEYWNTCTRPIENNGFNWSIEETSAQLNELEKHLTVLYDDERVYRRWKTILETNEVKGVQVHDAHLAATLDVHGVRRLITSNATDFKRYQFIEALSPEEINV